MSLKVRLFIVVLCSFYGWKSVHLHFRSENSFYPVPIPRLGFVTVLCMKIIWTPQSQSTERRKFIETTAMNCHQSYEHTHTHTIHRIDSLILLSIRHEFQNDADDDAATAAAVPSLSLYISLSLSLSLSLAVKENNKLIKRCTFDSIVTQFDILISSIYFICQFHAHVHSLSCYFYTPSLLLLLFLPWLEISIAHGQRALN